MTRCTLEAVPFYVGPWCRALDVGNSSLATFGCYYLVISPRDIPCGTPSVRLAASYVQFLQRTIRAPVPHTLGFCRGYMVTLGFFIPPFRHP